MVLCLGCFASLAMIRQFIEENTAEKVLCALFPSPLCNHITWLQASAWVAAVGGAVLALLTLWRQLSQARASFLLELEKQWESVSKARREMIKELDAVRKSVTGGGNRYAKTQKAATVRLKWLRENEYDNFYLLFSYLGFFETVGLMVRKGYIPLRDMIDLYKGPIHDIDVFFVDYVREWQKEPVMKEGLYEHTKYLIRWMRRNEYWDWRILIFLWM